jgi:hypothetical protein
LSEASDHLGDALVYVGRGGWFDIYKAIECLGDWAGSQSDLDSKQWVDVNVDAAPVKTEQPDAAAPKSRAAKKVHRPGRDAFASIGGWNSFWGGNDFGTRPGQPIHAAPGPRQR